MQLRKDDPNVTWEAFCQRFHMIYRRLNHAWNQQTLAPVRGLVTPSLLEYLQFWISEYKRQGLINRLEDARIHHISMAKTTRDKWYDAITVRVYADGVDYTTDLSAQVVGGERSSRRKYTELATSTGRCPRSSKTTFIVANCDRAVTLHR